MINFKDYLRWRTIPTAVAEIMADQKVIRARNPLRRKLSDMALRRRKKSLQLRSERRRLEHIATVMPPPQGHRRPEFCGDDDTFWTTPVPIADRDRVHGDITSDLVLPKRSLWRPFK